jgi:Nucleotidyltransferase of unknown function (DUF6036)
MRQSEQNIWTLISRGGLIDARRLLGALIRAEGSLDADTRSQILRRDVIAALSDHWGLEHLRRRLRRTGASAILEAATANGPGPGEGAFSTLWERIVDATNPDSLLQMLRELGTRITAPATLTIGGSLALMLDALIVRATDDAHVVDEIPAALRQEHALLGELASRYGLKLTHFQSHYLPDGWHGRIRSLGRFGKIDAFVVDSLDVLVGKLFSKRTKDLDDIRAAWPLMDQATFRDRVARSTNSFRKDPDLVASAQRNWYIVTGEPSIP